MPGSGSEPLLQPNSIPVSKNLSSGSYPNSLNKSVSSSEKPEEVLKVEKIMTAEDTRTYTMIKNIPVRYTQR